MRILNRTTTGAAVLIVFMAGAACAQQAAQDGTGEPPLPVSFKLTDEAVEAGFRPTFHLGSSFTLTPILRGGFLAPFGTLPSPYAILQTSPYGVVGFDARTTGAIESLVMATVGYTNLLSQKGIADPGGRAASPASSLPAQTQFSQQMAVGSAYADLGKVVTISPSVKAAFFAAADAFGVTSLRRAAGSYSASGLGEGNTGALVMYKKGQNEASAFADLRVEEAPKDMFRNGAVAIVPAGTFGAEYARSLRDGQRVAAGVEATTQRADLGLRPYVEWSQGKVSALVSGNFRRSNNDFYPNVAGGGAEVRVEVARGVQVGILGDFAHEKYSMAPEPTNTREMMVTLNIDLGRIFHSAASMRTSQRQDERHYQAQDSYDMNSRLPAANYAGTFKSALASSPNFTDFVKSLPAHSVDEILAAASAFTTSFSNNNYNYNERPVPNADNVDEIYRRGRASYLNGTNDPMLVCIGSAQFAAVLAEAMGKQAGIPIEAMASHVEVPDANGQQAGHAVAAVKTQPYGIVFVDWGKLTPTYTFDTKQAFRIYDALQGIPSVYHTVTAGDDGRHVGYLFTDEGKAIVNNLTFHDEIAKPPLEHLFNDDPRGAPLTVERFKALTRGKF